MTVLYFTYSREDPDKSSDKGCALRLRRHLQHPGTRSCGYICEYLNFSAHYVQLTDELVMEPNLILLLLLYFQCT